MEGLEISEVLYSIAVANPDFRVDAEFHKEMPPDNKQYKYVPISEILKVSQYGISITMNEDDEGYPIYRMNEILGMLASSTVLKYADVSREEAEPFILNEGDVLFNRTNSQAFVGRTGLFKPFGTEPRLFASYLVRFIPNPEIVLPEYLTTFLNSRLGVLDVKRRARISINQSNVNPEEVKAVRIPLLSLGLQSRIAKCFDDAHAAIITSNSTYSQAETLLLRELGLEGWQPPEPLTYQSTFSQAWSDGRLDAEHFQPKYAAMLDRVKKSAPRWRRVADFAAFCDRGAQPLYVEDGPLAVVNSRHILETGLDYDNFERTDAARWDDPNFFSSRLNWGDILTYTTGAKIGRTAAYLSDERALGSNHVNILRLREEDSIYVAVVLNSLIGRLQTRSQCTGSAQVEIYPSDIGKFVVPFVKEEIQRQIADAIQTAHGARRQAKQLLEAAKRAVETAIEDSEEAALAGLAAAENGGDGRETYR